jgi:hypothetical protein
MIPRHCERLTGARQSRFREMDCFVTLFLAMTVFIFPAGAAAYEPGTVGYLYRDCAYALQESKNPKEFLNSYCGGFVEGYGMGTLVSNSVQLGAPDAKDPCHDVKQREYERINARLCRNLPEYRDTKTPPGIIIQTVADIVFRWQEMLKKNKQMAIFKMPIAEQINDIVTPGEFCESVNTYAVMQNPGFIINPGLLNANWYDFVKSVPSTLQDKAERCMADLQKENFEETRCGAEIEGFIAGLYSTHHLQARDKVEGACGKEIDRLYQGLDMPGKMCVDINTGRRKVAQAFLKRIESMKKAGQSLKESGFGGAGYQSIYYGFMCKKETPEEPLTPLPN